MLISFLVGTIAGLAAAASGDTLLVFATFSGVFVAVEVQRAPRPVQRGWWHSDIMTHVGAMMLQSWLWRLARWTTERITGSYPADRRYIEHTTEPPVPQPTVYTGETIRFDPDTIPIIPNDDRSLWYICGICNMYVAPDHSCNALLPLD